MLWDQYSNLNWFCLQTCGYKRGFQERTLWRTVYAYAANCLHQVAAQRASGPILFSLDVLCKLYYLSGCSLSLSLSRCVTPMREAGKAREHVRKKVRVRTWHLNSFKNNMKEKCGAGKGCNKSVRFGWTVQEKWLCVVLQLFTKHAALVALRPFQGDLKGNEREHGLQHQHVRIFNARYLLSQFQQLDPRLQNLLELDSLDRNSKKTFEPLPTQCSQQLAWKGWRKQFLENSHQNCASITSITFKYLHTIKRCQPNESEPKGTCRAGKDGIAQCNRLTASNLIRLFCIDRWMSSSARGVVRAMLWSEIDLGQFWTNHARIKTSANCCDTSNLLPRKYLTIKSVILTQFTVCNFDIEAWARKLCNVDFDPKLGTWHDHFAQADGFAMIFE